MTSKVTNRNELLLKAIRFMSSNNMSPISETVIIGFGVMSTIASRLILADAAPEQQFALQWFLLPMLGALAASVCAMLLNPSPEARKTVLARSIFGVVAGTGIPKVVSMFHPALKEFSLDPAITFLSGFFICMVAYIVARPFVEKLYARSGDIAEHLEGHIEQKISQTITTKTETKTNVPPVPVIIAFAIGALFLSGCSVSRNLQSGKTTVTASMTWDDVAKIADALKRGRTPSRLPASKQLKK